MPPSQSRLLFIWHLCVYRLIRVYSGTILSVPGSCHPSWYCIIFCVHLGMIPIHLSLPMETQPGSGTFLKEVCIIRMSVSYLDVSENKLSGPQFSFNTLPMGFNNILFIWSPYVMFHCWSSEVIAAWDPSSTYASCVTLGKLLNLLQPQLPHLKNGNHIGT